MTDSSDTSTLGLPSTQHGAPDSGRVQVERRFLEHLLGPIAADWGDQVSPALEAQARATYFLVHQATDGGPDTRSFVTEGLERICQQLHSTTERELNHYRGRVQGRISWGSTIKARHTNGYNPTTYACIEVRRQIDTPQNQLLKALVEAIWKSLEAVPPILKAGTIYNPQNGEHSSETLERSLQRIEDTVMRIRNHPRLKSVTLPSPATDEQLRRAEQSKQEEYGLAAQLYQSYTATMTAGWDSLVTLSRGGLPVPATVEGEGDRWLRLAAALVRMQGVGSRRDGTVTRI